MLIFFMSLTMTNQIYENIFNTLYSRKDEILKNRGIDIGDKLPKIYNYFSQKSQKIPVVDEYILELESDNKMTVYITDEGVVYNCENIKIGTCDFIEKLINLD